MASGTITGSTGNQYIDAKIEWSSKANTTANTSAVTAALYYKRNNTGHTTSGTGTFHITINGTKTSVTKTVDITENAWVKVVEATVTVTHNYRGARTITISASGSIPNTTLTSTNVSGNAVLDTIPRETLMNSLSCSTKYFNGTLTFKFTPQNNALYNKCYIHLIISGVSTEVTRINLGKLSASQQTKTVTFIPSELSKIYNKIPNGTLGTLRFTVVTYEDQYYTKDIGNGTYREITLSIPNNSSTQPEMNMTISPVHMKPLPDTFKGLYLSGLTKIDANFTDVETKYEASQKSLYMTVLGTKYGSPYTTGYIIKNGTIVVEGTITDSRGFSSTYSEGVTFLPYSSPRLVPASGYNEIVCKRCDANGNFIDSGTYLRIKAKRSYSKVVSNGSQLNFCQIRYRYKVEGGSYSGWTTILAPDAVSDEVDTGALLSGALDVKKSYVVQVGVLDTLGDSNYIPVGIPTEKVYMHRAGSINSLGIGKYAEEENTVDIAEEMTAIFRGEVQFKSEAWVELPLGTSVTKSTVNSGRWGGTGVFYRVCAGGKHVYVAFNISFTTSNSTVRAESYTIPCPPDYDVYALCPVGFSDGSRGIATVSISPNGRVNIYAVHKLPGATLSTSETVNWIDGYIDYWI